MSAGLYKVINPMVKMILRSSLHGLMSGNTLLIEFEGRKTGRKLSTPISYHVVGDQVSCFTSRSYPWWRNLIANADVAVRLKGCLLNGRANVTEDQPDQILAALRDFLIAVPRDASHAGVRLDPNGQPVGSDLVEASKRLVHISIELPLRASWCPPPTDEIGTGIKIG